MRWSSQLVIVDILEKDRFGRSLPQFLVYICNYYLTETFNSFIETSMYGPILFLFGHKQTINVDNFILNYVCLANQDIDIEQRNGSHGWTICKSSRSKHYLTLDDFVTNSLFLFLSTERKLLSSWEKTSHIRNPHIE